MLKSNKASLGAIALALGGIAVLSAGDGADKVVSAGAKAARKAAKALTRHDTDEAIGAAEQAVALAPTEAAYRMILGQSYLQGGRFRSAGEAFADTLRLESGNGRAALNLALAQVAVGDWQAARHTLDAHSADIPASDRGLAMALAGDTTGAVALLTQVARSPDASPKVRQNLALAYALAGQWGIARTIAAADMSPADVDARLAQWAAFAQPREASDQVASLLGVRPAADAGQPAALALNAPAQSPPATATVMQVAAATPVTVVAVPPAPRVAFAAAKEVVQPLPAATVPAAGTAFKTTLRTVARATAMKPAKAGDWHVQLGAFRNSGVAKDAWGRATHRFAGFRGHAPQGVTFRTAKASFYRLSVGGFSRAAANQACRAYRAHGGTCFVRMSAGDQVASWATNRNVQLALR